MSSPSPGPWMNSPPVVYKFGQSSYVDTGPYRELGTRYVSSVNQMGYSLDQYATVDKEEVGGTIWSDGFPAGSYHYSGSFDVLNGSGGSVSRGGYQAGDSVAHFPPSPFTGTPERSGYKYETYTGFNYWVALRPDDSRYCGYVPMDWDADFWDLLGGDPPIIGYDVTGTFGTRRYMESGACVDAGATWSAYFDTYADDMSSMGETAYWDWYYDEAPALTTSSGWTVTGSADVYGTLTYGAGQVCWAPFSSLGPAPYSNGGKRRIPPDASFSGTVAGSSGTLGGTWESPTVFDWSFTVPYREAWCMFSNWAPLPPYGLTAPANGTLSMSGQVDARFLLVSGTVNSPWQYRLLYAVGAIPNLTGGIDTQFTRMLRSKR